MKKNMINHMKKGFQKMKTNNKKFFIPSSTFSKYNFSRFYSTSGESVLIVSEHNNKDLISGTLNTIAAASKISSNVEVLVAGHNAESVVEQAKKLKGVSKVLYCNDSIYENPLAENLSKLVVEVQKKKNFTHILAPASSFGKNILPRVAGYLDVGAITDILKIDSVDTFRRPIYAGNAIQTVKSLDNVKVVSVRTTAFEKTTVGGDAPVENVTQSNKDTRVKYLGSQLTKSERPDLQTANIVVSGGRGLKSGENFELLYQLAKKMNAAVGASRAAVDAGFVPNDMQIGQTGKIVAPQLYVAVGISGAIQHLAGMKDSKVIVAINKDTEAPIFQVSDYGLVADLFKAVPEFTQLLK